MTHKHKIGFYFDYDGGIFVNDVEDIIRRVGRNLEEVVEEITHHYYPFEYCPDDGHQNTGNSKKLMIKKAEYVLKGGESVQIF